MRRILILAIGICMMSVSGCAMQADMIDMENEVKIMKGMLLETQRDVSTLQKAQQVQKPEPSAEQTKEMTAKAGDEVRDSVDKLQKNQADFEIRFDQVSTDVQVIQGNLEENSHKIMEFSEDMDNQNAALEELTRKLEAVEARLNTALSAASSATSGPPPENKKDTVISAPAVTPSDIYNQAYKDYLAGNYDLAITGFTNYLSHAPDGNLAPNSVYWIGESYYSKGEYQNALNQFKKFTDGYPRSDKLAGALLKMGYACEKMGNMEMAKVYLKKVIEQFPNTQEASHAKVKLAELK
ncbi:MAG: tol-pal system protein YbgF [Nitrospira sp.]|nr:tol-pal system protein YbgF [Nitrospira sp.]